MSNNLKKGLEALLRPEDSIVVLIDHQPFQFTNLNSHEPMAIINEWQRDHARTETAAGLADVLVEHGGASGVAFLWEQQLLNAVPQ